jgi:hypothetical protein
VDDWRDPHPYEKLRGIDRAGLMWEWLRRDADYIDWYAKASTATRETGTPACWGLHFCREPGPPRPQARVVWSAAFDPDILPVTVAPAKSRTLIRCCSGISSHGSPSQQIQMATSMSCCRMAGSISDSMSRKDGSWGMRPCIWNIGWLGLPLPTPCSCLSGAFLGCVASTGFRRRCFRAIRVLRGVEVLRISDALEQGASQRDVAVALVGKTVSSVSGRARRISCARA